MQKRRNIWLLIVLVGLIGINILVFTWNNNTSATAFDEKLFSIQDTAQIERIEIVGKDFENEIKKVGQQWMVNGQYKLDEGLRRTLLPVLREIRVRRTVSENQKEEVIDLLKNHGTKITVYSQKGVINTFLSAGNREENLTYFMLSDNQQPYVVHLPGYESYVAGLFEIPENDWRDRIVMNILWQSLKELHLVYPNNQEKSFSIKASDQFFSVPGIQYLDSARVFDYLQQVEYILTDKYIQPGEFSEYDSLAKTNPMAILKLESIGDELQSITFYPSGENDRYQLGVTETGQMVLFEVKRIAPYFVEKSDFDM